MENPQNLAFTTQRVILPIFFDLNQFQPIFLTKLAIRLSTVRQRFQNANKDAKKAVFQYSFGLRLFVRLHAEPWTYWNLGNPGPRLGF